MQKKQDFLYVLQLRRLVEKDTLIRRNVWICLKVRKKVLDGLVHVMEKDGGLDREAALANMRFQFY